MLAGLAGLILAALAAVFLNGLANLRVFRPIRRVFGARDREPLVSVLVPARNEAPRIRACLESLAGQTWTRLEVLALDDESEDGTGAILEEVAERSAGRVRALRGKSKPDGWGGKNWACWQLAQCARGEVLIFTDADTVHAPECVASAVAALEETRADLLSLWPQQVTGTLAEKLVIPLGYLVFLGLLPLWLLAWFQRHPARARRISSRGLGSLGVANGQCLVFRRDAYERLGGHAALKGHLVEDVAFGRRAAAGTAEGVRVVNRDGSGVIACRMYEGARDVWMGFSKNLRPVFEESAARYWLSGGMLAALFLLPFGLALAAGAAGRLGMAACGILIFWRVVLAARFRTSWLSVLLHPAGMAFVLLVSLNSWRWHRSGRIEWKGRRYASK